MLKRSSCPSYFLIIQIDPQYITVNQAPCEINLDKPSQTYTLSQTKTSVNDTNKFTLGIQGPLRPSQNGSCISRINLIIL